MSVLQESVVVILLNKFFLLCLQGPIPCFIEKVLMTTNADEVTLIKILLRQTRRPELGDNFLFCLEQCCGSQIRIFPSRIQGQKDSWIRIRIKDSKYFSTKNVSRLSEI